MDETAQTYVTPGPSRSAERLDVGACWELLRGVEIGRLAVVVDGSPDIFPLNFVVDHGTLVFRTADGTKLAAAVTGATVAFEADGLNRTLDQAWSVVVKGRAEEVRDLEGLLDVSDLPLKPMQGSPKHRFVRIVPDEISGRRFTVVDPAVWDNPYSLRRASHWD